MHDTTTSLATHGNVTKDFPFYLGIKHTNQAVGISKSPCLNAHLLQREASELKSLPLSGNNMKYI